MSPAKTTARPDGQAIVPLSGNKQYRAYKMHLSGIDWEAIAEELGYKNGRTAQVTVRTYIQESAIAMERARKDEVIEIELARLDHMQAIHWQELEDTHDTKHTMAILGIMKHRKELLRLGEEDDSLAHATVIVQGTTEEYIAALQAGSDG